MKYYLIILSFLLFSDSFSQIPISDFIWKMETVKELENITSTPADQVVLEPGYLGLSVALTASSRALNMTDFVDFYDEFTLSFWFRAKDLMKQQSVFRQSRFLNKTNRESRFIELFVKDKQVFVQTEKETKQLDSLVNSENGESWHWVTYSADRYGYDLMVDGEEVYSSKDGTMFRKLGDSRDQLLIGAGGNSFEGNIDEIRAFKTRLEEEEITDLYEDYLEQRLEELKKKQTEKVVEEAPKVEVPECPFDINKRFKGRFNKAPAAVYYTDSDEIYLNLWDYYGKEIDGDEISVYLNEESRLIRERVILDKKKRKEQVRIKLEDYKDNYIVFYARNTGDYYSAATVAASMEGLSRSVEFTAHRDSNAVIKIIRRAKEKKEEKKEEVVSIVELPDLKIAKEELTMEFSPFSKEDYFEDVVVVGQKSGEVQHLKLAPEGKRIKIPLKGYTSEKVLIYARQLEKGEQCKARIVIKEGPQLHLERVLDLHKEKYEQNISIKAPLTKIETGKRMVVVPKTTQKLDKVTLVISDHDNPDGDKVKLWYGDEVIMETLTLLESPWYQTVDLKEGNKHQITIEALDFGTSPEPINTPKVQVLVNGKVVDEFVFWLRKAGGKDKGLIELTAK